MFFVQSVLWFIDLRPIRPVLEGQETCNPPITHPVFDDAHPRQGKFLEVQGANVVITHVKPAEDGRGLIVRLINLGDQPATARVALPGSNLGAAWICDTLEDKQSKLAISDGCAVCRLEPRRITTIRLLRR